MTPPGKWHTYWQSFFDDTEVPFDKLPDCVKSRRADCVVGDYVYEMQHSFMSQQEVKDRCHDYGMHGKSVVWIVDGTQGVTVKHLQLSNTFLLNMIAAPWKYQSFVTSDIKYIYLHINEYIYRVPPQEVRSSMIDVVDRKTIQEFVDWVKDPSNPDFSWDERVPTRCTLYYNQRGAGCGKTYESIQLINKHQDKRTYIYLTKVHSAKEVIASEFNSQLKAGKLHEVIDATPDGQQVKGKQYQIEFTRESNGDACKIIIGTIDSFMYALGDKEFAKKGRDYFSDLVRSIAVDKYDASYDKTSGFTSYTSEGVYLNKECIVIVDESQDLLVTNGVSYIDAIIQIMRETYIDLYMIGDKLQSIWGEDNVYTQFASLEIPYVNTEVNIGTNVVRRFHHTAFMKLVNDVVPFQEYQLPAITGICDGHTCSYAPHRDDDINPITVWTPCRFGNMHHSSSEESRLARQILADTKRIIKAMEEEIFIHGYLPCNFMFIFPYMKKNILAETLERHLQQFWIQKFKDPKYRKLAIEKHSYWRQASERDPCHKSYYRYAVLHKSEGNRPINLRESEHASRLLTIHASKGQGCEVVFLLGMTENALKIYSNGHINLVYDSLLHVAVTRQKVSLYVYVEPNSDDIHKRFQTYIPVDESGSTQQVLVGWTFPSKKFDTHKIATDILCSSYDDIKGIVDKFRYVLRDTSDKQGSIIDWSDHVVRYCLARYTMLSEIQRRYTNYKNIKHIIEKFQSLPIETFDRKEYDKRLWDFTPTRKNKYSPKIDCIPVLSLDTNNKYKDYEDALISIIKNIKRKLQCTTHLRCVYLCLIEKIVFVHYQEVFESGVYTTNVNAMSIYKMLHAYETCNADAKAFHDSDGSKDCVCNRVLDTTTTAHQCDVDLSSAFMNHMGVIETIKRLFEGFDSDMSRGQESYNPKDIQWLLDDIHITCDDKKDFVIKTCIEYIAIHDNKTIHCMLKPSLDTLNFNEVIMTMLVDVCNNMITLDPDDIRGGCVFTYTEQRPIFIRLTEHLTQDDVNLIRRCIRSFMISKHQTVIDQIMNIYQLSKTTHKKYPTLSAIEDIQRICDRDADTNGLDYIKKYFIEQHALSKNNRCDTVCRDQLIDIMKKHVNNLIPIHGEDIESESSENDYDF